jgi:hypothetical protein
MLALIVALVVVAGLWYWWTSNQPDAPQNSDQDSSISGVAPEQPVRPSGEVSAADRAGALFSNLRSGVANVISAAGSPSTSRTAADGTAITGEMIEVLRLYRDLSNGALVVQIGRDKYYSLEEIADLQVRRRFLGNAEAMAQFAQLKKGTSPLIDWTSPPATVSQERPEPVQPPPPPMAPQPPNIAPASSYSAEPTPVQPAPSLFSSLLGGPKPAEAGDKEGEPPKPKSMADEIEELLQYRLALDPVLAQRSVHIRSADDGSILVEVDNTRFDSVGSVTDPEIKAFLQKVVQEWEARK